MPQKRSRQALFVLLLVAFFTPLCAYGQEVHEGGYSSLVVQNRKNFGTHEFGVALGTLPLDAFTKGLTVSGAYTLHFTEHIGWEVAQFTYSFPVDTALHDELNAFDLQPTPFEILEYFVMTNFLFKPVYWKGSWMNSNLIYGELFFLAGGGYGWFTRSSRPGVDIGAGFRVYGTSLVSIRFDARYMFYFDDTIFTDFNVMDELWVGLGGSLAF